MVYHWPRITGISVTGVGIALIIFAVWAMFVTTAPAEQFQQDPIFAGQYVEYYRSLTAFGSVMIIGGGILYYLHRRSMKEIERER
ncbi:MAG: hypothetical protein ACE5J2_03755 [Nitrososphaerales archaeon]